MNKELVIELKDFATEIGKLYSIKDREQNFNNEIFTVHEIIPMSDHTAAVIYNKDTGKRAVFFFYYINNGKSRGWKYFVPTDSHILGFMQFHEHKSVVEKYNYEYNFKIRRHE